MTEAANDATEQFTPGPGYIIMRQWTDADLPAGQIINPHAGEKKLAIGTVIKYHPGGSPAKTLYETADIVVVGDYAPTTLPGEVFGKNIVLIRDEDVLGTFPAGFKPESQADPVITIETPKEKPDE